MTPKSLTRVALRFQPRAGLIGLLSAIFLLVAVWQGPGALGTGLGLVGGTMLALVALIYALSVSARLSGRRSRRNIAEFVSHDAAPCFVTDDDGAIWYVNAAAEKRFRDGAVTLSELLGDVFVNPQAVLFRLRKRAEVSGAAREDVITRRGHVRLTTHRIGEADYFWRLEEIAERAGGNSGKALLPSITVGRRGTILFMNDGARKMIGTRLKRLDQLFGPAPFRPGAVNDIHTTEGPRTCFVSRIDLQGGRQELFLLPTSEEASAQSARVSPVGEETWSEIEALPVPLLKVNPNGTVMSANGLARDLLGQPNVEGERLSSLMEGLGRSITDWLSEVASGTQAKSSEFLRVTRPDKEVFVQVTLKLASSGGEAEDSAVIAVLSDATELKTLEMQFVQSQKMQAIGQLAGGVAHDFNNLLTAISGHCDLLLLRHDQGDPDYNDLTQINQNSNRAAALVGQLLAFSRKQTLRLETIDLRETLSDLTHLLNRLVGEKIILSLSHDADLHKLRADKRQLEQVVMNLVVNARDAMPEGGAIRIETLNSVLKAPLQRDRATVPAGGYVVVRVSDQGIGIPPDKRQKIFEPFWTTKKPGEGTGLGLSTAYGIIKQLGGFIFCDSQPGEGTVFTLMFPARDKEAGAEQHAQEARAGKQPEAQDDAPRKPRAVSGAASGQKPSPVAGENAGDTPSRKPEPVAARTGAGPASARSTDGAGAVDTEQSASAGTCEGAVVLLVEDEAPVRAFASRALRLNGFTVIEADSAEGALKTLEETDLAIDIFVTDVVMPGMDGPSWVRKALKQRPETRVVFVSGYAEESFREGQSAIPNSVFLPKPFSLSELTETVQRQLH